MQIKLSRFRPRAKYLEVDFSFFDNQNKTTFYFSSYTFLHLWGLYGGFRDTWYLPFYFQGYGILSILLQEVWDTVFNISPIGCLGKLIMGIFASLQEILACLLQWIWDIWYPHYKPHQKMAKIQQMWCFSHFLDDVISLFNKWRQICISGDLNIIINPLILHQLSSCEF